MTQYNPVVIISAARMMELIRHAFINNTNIADLKNNLKVLILILSFLFYFNKNFEPKCIKNSSCLHIKILVNFRM